MRNIQTAVVDLTPDHWVRAIEALRIAVPHVQVDTSSAMSITTSGRSVVVRAIGRPSASLRTGIVKTDSHWYLGNAIAAKVFYNLNHVLSPPRIATGGLEELVFGLHSNDRAIRILHAMVRNGKVRQI